MLNLICGTALRPARAAALAPPFSDDTLIIVPDDLTACSVLGELYAASGDASPGQRIIDLPTMLELLTGDAASGPQWLPDSLQLVVLRNVIESLPKSYDYLVGRNSVPRLTHGVLKRIHSALKASRNDQAAGQEPDFLSAREKQLRLLDKSLQDRMASAGVRLQQHGQLEALSSLKKSTWATHFKGIKKVIVTDFYAFNDVTFFLVNAMRRHVEHCHILLDFDPDGESSPLELAYQKFYEAADHVAIYEDELDAGQTELFDAAIDTEQHNALVISAPTVARETKGAAAWIAHHVKSSPESDTPRLVVALTNWEEYSYFLENELTDLGVNAIWEELHSPLKNGAWALIEKLRDASSNWTAGAAISRLWRSPGFSAIMTDVTPVEAWNLASRLDYVLSLTGELKGWQRVVEGTERFLGRLHAERRKIGQLSLEEEALDQRLTEVLKATAALQAPYAEKLPVKEWSVKVISLLQSLFAWKADPVHAKEHEIVEAMLQTASTMGLFSAAISSTDVSFQEFVALYRTALQDCTVDNREQLTGDAVIVCRAATAARLRGDYCLILGCNDGQFPRFAKPDAVFTGPSFRTSQAAFRTGQKMLLDRILGNYKQALLWMPKLAGTEELLPSQFVEELLLDPQVQAQELDELLADMGATRESSRARALAGEFIENVSRLVLNEGELNRFANRGAAIQNIAWSTSLLSSRNRPNLGEFDGIITDPVLREWLAAWADRHIYSVSQLDTVVGCSFRFFADRMLNLEELEEADDLLPAHTFGSFTHDVLARFYRAWVAESRGVPQFIEEQLAREKLCDAYEVEHEKSTDLSDFAQDLLNLKLFGDLGLEGFRSDDSLLEEITDPGVFGQFLLMEMKRAEEHGLDLLKPSNFEVGFGMGRMEEDDPMTRAEYLELDLGEGEKIKLRGRIDRIDLSPAGLFAVTDYKTGRIPEKQQILGGFRTQLPVYILVGTELLRSKFAEPDPAGGLYYSLRRGEDVKVSGVFFRAAYQAHAGIQGRCLKDEDFDATLEKVRSFMRHSLKAVRQGYLTTTWKDSDTVCKFCSFEGLCYRNVDRTAAFWNGLGESPAEVS